MSDLLFVIFALLFAGACLIWMMFVLVEKGVRLIFRTIFRMLKL